MIRYQHLTHRFVDDMPETLDPGYLYVSMRYALAMHLCCCGCGREVATPLSPAQWKLLFDGEEVSLSPSIGNWNLACRSHYFIRRGKVVEAQPWSDKDVALGQTRDRRARNVHYGDKTRETVASPAPEFPIEPLPRGRLAWFANALKRLL